MNKILIAIILGVLLSISAVYLVLLKKKVKYAPPVEKKPKIEQKPSENITQENITPEEYMEQLLANMSEEEPVELPE